jgi:hypothetical protein
MNTCARSLPTCKGEVRIYIQALRPVDEQHRLCEACVADLTAAPLNLRFIDVGQQAYIDRAVERFVPFGAA